MLGLSAVGLDQRSEAAPLIELFRGLSSFDSGVYSEAHLWICGVLNTERGYRYKRPIP